MTNTGFQENNFSLKAGLNRIDHGFDIFYSFSNQLGISIYMPISTDIINAINNEMLGANNEFSYDINVPRQRLTTIFLKIKAFKNFNFAS